MDLRTVEFSELSLPLKVAVFGGWIIAFLVSYYVLAFLTGFLLGLAGVM